MLNISKGNMYSWVTHTWNTIKGDCSHGCTYCYMKRFGNLKPIRLDQKEFNTDLGSGNIIFVGSSTDMFEKSVPFDWIQKTLSYCDNFDNIYLFQTKNPARFAEFSFPRKTRLCITLETNRYYPEIMQLCPPPVTRAANFSSRWIDHYSKYITIEPVMEFDTDVFLEMLQQCNPTQVNIGADSGRNNLPEPLAEKLNELILRIKEFTIVDRKRNLKRLL